MALFSLQLKPLTLSELFHCHMNSHGPELTHMSFFFFFFLQTNANRRVWKNLFGSWPLIMSQRHDIDLVTYPTLHTLNPEFP